MRLTMSAYFWYPLLLAHHRCEATTRTVTVFTATKDKATWGSRWYGNATTVPGLRAPLSKWAIPPVMEYSLLYMGLYIYIYIYTIYIYMGDINMYIYIYVEGEREIINHLLSGMHIQVWLPGSKSNPTLWWWSWYTMMMYGWDYINHPNTSGFGLSHVPKYLPARRLKYHIIFHHQEVNL